MAKTGDELVNPIGERLIFRQTAGDTHGALLAVEMVYRPHSSPPPAHYHPYQEERFHVLQGVIRATIGHQEYTYQAGDEFVIPPGVRHWMHNISDDAGRVIWQTRPALKTETFIETLWGLARDGKTHANGVPHLLQVAVMAQAYAQEFRLAQPPYGLQKVLFAILAPLGRWLGYSARYERYGGQADFTPAVKRE